MRRHLDHARVHVTERPGLGLARRGLDRGRLQVEHVLRHLGSLRTRPPAQPSRHLIVLHAAGRPVSLAGLASRHQPPPDLGGRSEWLNGTIGRLCVPRQRHAVRVVARLLHRRQRDHLRLAVQQQWFECKEAGVDRSAQVADVDARWRHLLYSNGALHNRCELTCSTFCKEPLADIQRLRHALGGQRRISVVQRISQLTNSGLALSSRLCLALLFVPNALPVPNIEDFDHGEGAHEGKKPKRFLGVGPLVRKKLVEAHTHHSCRNFLQYKRLTSSNEIIRQPLQLTYSIRVNGFDVSVRRSLLGSPH